MENPNTHNERFLVSLKEYITKYGLLEKRLEVAFGVVRPYYLLIIKNNIFNQTNIILKK